ncbi:Transcription factor MYB1R1 [Gossypium arboreum]|uniref:Transcription factor MYB1R1 n=1 Tax=Gossypium arboreum TaxID=29729 RepID=A0A0B0NH77_GOSAR|nr:Transcription factor MYB1R1 [Gossypium arboreum]
MLPTICSTASSSAGNSIANCGERGEIMLFGPRESNNNNKVGDKYKGEEYVTADYASADDVIPHSTKNRERKRGIPWTVEEHKLFC